MKDGHRRCMRCNGRKKLYKVCGAYSLVDTGGIEMLCPLCMGEGEIPTLEEAAKRVELEKLKKENSDDGKKESRQETKTQSRKEKPKRGGRKTD